MIASSYFWPISVTISGGTGSFGALSNSIVVNALPSVNSRTVTALELSGDGPDAIVPLLPTDAGWGAPVTLLLSEDFAPSRAVAAAEASGRIMIVSPMTRLPAALVNPPETPGWPPGLGVAGIAVKVSLGTTMSVALISRVL